MLMLRCWRGQADNVLFEEPTDEEVEEYAVYLGMDPVKDHDLLWIARQVVP